MASRTASRGKPRTKVLKKPAKSSPKAPQGAKSAGKASYRFTLRKKGEDQYGGIPAGVSEESWPRCAECKHPLQFLFLLETHPARNPLRKNAAVAVFMCDGELTQGSCATYDPDSGANAVLLLGRKAWAIPALSQAPAGEKHHPEPLAQRAFHYREKLEHEPADETNSRGIANKVGGYAAWLQGTETQKCRKCSRPMRFVAQLGDQRGQLNFGDVGAGYLFVCPQEHEGRFLWQSC